MKTLLMLLFVLITAPYTQAESGVIGISVRLDEKSIPKATIVSSWKENNAIDVTVPEAVKKIAAAQNPGSLDYVG